ncbi:hypothetical protein [Streptococcus parasanguinis]|uniref:hypothetical protein n=1 Tax=Streptococcus parasanguinis TaxID=1318 RepID=UPI00255655D2|nr:hypothetical protein [Streptococcus parasanguinis]MDK8141799.1 hypothetical protein [Streptococcus parasanguinis]
MIFSFCSMLFFLTCLILWCWKGKNQIDRNYDNLINDLDNNSYNSNQINKLREKVKNELFWYILSNLISSFIIFFIGLYLKINLDIITIAINLLTIFIIFVCYGSTEPILIGYKGISINKNIVVYIWNYLAFKEEGFDKYEMFIKNKDGISIKEIQKVKNTLLEMSKEDLIDINEAIEVSQNRTIYELISESIGKYFLALFSMFFGLDSIGSIVNTLNKNNKQSGVINNIVQFITKNAAITFCIACILGLIFCFILWWVNNMTIINRRRHCSYLLKKYVDEALEMKKEIS